MVALGFIMKGFLVKRMETGFKGDTEGDEERQGMNGHEHGIFFQKLLPTLSHLYNKPNPKIGNQRSSNLKSIYKYIDDKRVQRERERVRVKIIVLFSLSPL